MHSSSIVMYCRNDATTTVNRCNDNDAAAEVYKID
jgi:hypothetical protein